MEQTFEKPASHPRFALWLGLVVLVLALVYVFLFYKRTTQTITTGPTQEEQQKVYDAITNVVPEASPQTIEQKDTLKAVGVPATTTKSGPSQQEQDSVINFIGAN